MDSLFDEDDEEYNRYSGRTAGSASFSQSQSFSQLLQLSQKQEETRTDIKHDESKPTSTIEKAKGKNDQIPSQQSTKHESNLKSAEEEILCDVCGGDDFYKDDVTNLYICSTCYTQSQKHFEEVDMDGEDNGHGRIISGGGRIGTSSRPRIRIRGHDLESYLRNYQFNEYALPFHLDQSIAMPSMETCLGGMKSLLVKSMKCLLQLMDVNSSDSRYDLAMDNIRTIWLSYLTAWYDAAEYYGEIHPTMRFSFRDYFLGSAQSMYLRLMLRQRAVMVAEQLEKEGNEVDILENPSAKSNSEGEFPEPFPAMKSTKDGNIDSNKVEDKIGQEKKDSSRSTTINSELESCIKEQLLFRNVSFRVMLDVHFSNTCSHSNVGDRNRRGYKEAALTVSPSMSMVAAILWLSINRAKIAASSVSVCTWMANGQLPLQNGYDRFLDSDQQRKSLELVADFFKMKRVPSSTSLEAISAVVCVACQFEKQIEQYPEQDTDGETATKNYSHSKLKSMKRKSVHHHTVRLWPVSSLPIIASQIVYHAGFDQLVLDRSLALLGYYNRTEHTSTCTSVTVVDFETMLPPRSPLLPAPLVDPKYVTRTEDIVAIICIACQLDPSWRLLKYPCGFATTTTKASGIKSPIPTNDGELRLLLSKTTMGRNGSLALRSYIDYLENIYVAGDGSKRPQNELKDEDDSIQDIVYNMSHDVRRNSWLPEPYWQYCDKLNGLIAEESSSFGDDSANATSEYGKNIHSSAMKLSRRRKYIDDHSSIIATKKCGKRKTSIFHPVEYERMDRLHQEWIPPNATSDTQVQTLVQYLCYTARIDDHDLVYKTMRLFLSLQKNSNRRYFNSRNLQET